ncbi:MAG: hypothetical protein HY053_07585 [Proteobacteria bacterium]|nr:hypothetical protein [Pseudomonadota bacterium]
MAQQIRSENVYAKEVAKDSKTRSFEVEAIKAGVQSVKNAGFHSFSLENVRSFISDITGPLNRDVLKKKIEAVFAEGGKQKHKPKPGPQAE